MPEYADFELTVLAEEDLKSIAGYTKDTWGLQQDSITKPYYQIDFNRLHVVQTMS